jgi:hypothetical protein
VGTLNLTNQKPQEKGQRGSTRSHEREVLKTRFMALAAESFALGFFNRWRKSAVERFTRHHFDHLVGLSHLNLTDASSKYGAPKRGSDEIVL